MKDFGWRLQPEGPCLSPQHCVPLFLNLGVRDQLLHDNVPSTAVALAISFDANNMLKGKTSQLISCFLSQARQPHQLPLQLPLCRYVDGDHDASTAVNLKRLGLLPVLEQVLQAGLTSGPMRLVWSPDWAALGQMLGTPPSTARICCAECEAEKIGFS